MKSDQNRLRFLLQRFAENSCSRAEMDELFEFIAKSKDNRHFNNELLTIWNSIHPGEKLSSIDENVIFRQIEEKINFSPVRRMWPRWANVAAVVFAFTIAGIIYFILDSKKSSQFASSNPVSTAITKPEHKLINLPDGSSVLLNANSTLEFPAQFSGSTREVVLKGEAYFDIDKDPDHPFIIHTGKLLTRVLGTAFNIRAYPEELDVTVTVTRGKVKVETEDKILGILTPNQQISFNKKNNSVVQHQVLADSVLTWKEKDFVFDNLTFEEAANLISERYGVSIRFTSENMKKCRFYASFLNENQLDQVLTVLCDLNKATYQINDNVVVISGNGCN